MASRSWQENIISKCCFPPRSCLPESKTTGKARGAGRKEQGAKRGAQSAKRRAQGAGSRAQGAGRGEQSAGGKAQGVGRGARGTIPHSKNIINISDHLAFKPFVPNNLYSVTLYHSPAGDSSVK